MNILSTIFSGGVSNVVDSVGNAIDKLVTSDAEKLQLKNELIKIQTEANLRAEDQALQYEAQITDRWKSDNEHIITRLVRPLTVAWLVLIFSAMAFTDGNIGAFKINPAYIPTFETLLITAIVALFGSRGAEKITSNIKK